MSDPLITAAALQVAKSADSITANASKGLSDLVVRFLGPTVDDMALDLAYWRRQRREERLVRRAAAKSDLTLAASVPPRVVADAFDAITWTDDEMLAEYLSGVLASSRTPEGNDDRGVAWVALLKSMSATQIRLHYVLYGAVRRLLLKQSPREQEQLAHEIFFSDEDVVREMGSHSADADDSNSILTPDPGGLYEAFHGLAAHDLIRGMTHGDGAALAEMPWTSSPKMFHSFPATGGFVFVPSTRGTQLYLHAHGLGQYWASAIRNPDLDFETQRVELGFEHEPSGVLIRDMPGRSS